MKTLKMLAATVAAIGMGMMLIAYDASDRAVIATTFAVAILLSLVLGVFDVKQRAKHTSIKDKAGRSYGQAAVFVGTACLFIGTQTECDERADDLWHYGVQADVQQLTGEETQFDII